MGDSEVSKSNQDNTNPPELNSGFDSQSKLNSNGLSSGCQSPTSSPSSSEARSVLEEKDVLLQHHHDLSNLCRDLEQHKLVMQRQHMHLAEALRNLGPQTNHEQDSCQQKQQQHHPHHHPPHHHHPPQQQQQREKLRTRKEGRDEHGMNGASAFTFASNSTIPTATDGGGSCSVVGGCVGGGGGAKRDIWDEEIASESLEEGLVTEIPEFLKSSAYSSGLPPRTIPFRSASFSQVDITSEGKYVRNPRSPITLKPTAFCLMNNSYASGSSTLPRTHGSTPKQHKQLISSNSTDAGDGTAGGTLLEQETLSSQTYCPPMSYHHQHHHQAICGIDGGISPSAINAFTAQQFMLPETINELADSNCGNELSELGNCSNMDNSFREESCEDSGEGGKVDTPDLPAAPTFPHLFTKLSEKGIMDNAPSSPADVGVADQRKGLSGQGESTDNSDTNGNGRSELQSIDSLDQEANNVQSEIGESETRHASDCKQGGAEQRLGMEGESVGSSGTQCTLSSPPSSPLPQQQPDHGSDGQVRKGIMLNCVEAKSGPSDMSISGGDRSPSTVHQEDNNTCSMDKSTGSENSTKEDPKPIKSPVRQHKPQLMRSPPLIREESIMARSSSEEGPKSDQEDEQPSLVPTNPPPSSLVDKSVPKSRKIKKQVLLDLGMGGASSISGSGGEDEADKDKHGLFRQSSGQSDESGEGDRQSDGCTSPPICPHSAGLPLHRSHLSAGNSPLTEALALDSTMRRGSTSAPATTAPTSAHSASNLHSTSLPQTSSGSSQSYFKTSNDEGSENCLGTQRDSNERINSLSSPNVYRQIQPRRYNKRPLRGPYGEMLEAEMKKLVPPRTPRDYDTFNEFSRESKSSSPNRTQAESDSGCGSSRTTQPATKLASSYLMSSMDDLNLTKPKHSSIRSRKISANLPVSHYQTKEDGTPMAFHQRTASSPSQLLYATSSSISTSDQDSSAVAEQHRHQLDASPRGHVLAEIVETEKSYVDSLRILVKKYMEPLKASDIVDNALVDEIFFQVPLIFRHHEQLLDDLQRTVTDDNQCVGNVFLDTFRQPTLLDCYSLFVSNWNNAKSSLKLAITSKPQLARFLETQARQHKGKLSVDSLLIMPIQRIPRYELLLKELLKHTEPTHEDHSRVMLALEKIKKFAIHINCSSVDLNGSKEFDIEGWNYGLGHLVRQDVVTLCYSSSSVKKERALFLFADSLLIASIKRKGTMRRIPQVPNPANNFEGCKFKLLTKVHLTDVHISSEELEACKGAAASSASAVCGGAAAAVVAHTEDMDDLKTVQKMMDLATLLKCPHVGLDEVLRDLATGLKHHGDTDDILEIEVKGSDSSDTPEALKVIFGSSEKKISWVEAFQETLSKFTRFGFGKQPQVQFIQALPIRKTRAGLQLSCAAPVTVYNKGGKGLEVTDLWVANSDGYVGQICILTLHPEPAITSCNGVCNSRITCIMSVPPASYPHLGTGSYHAESFSGSHDTPHHSHPNFHSLGYESEDDHHRRSQGHKSSTSEHWNVWLGTEDGGLHVYDCNDSIRVKKNRHKVQHKSPLNSMIFFNRRVFVALGNGDVAVYCRNPHGKGWLVNDASWVTIGSAMNPVTKMICVHAYIWCACGSQIKVYGDNGGMLELIQTIQIVIDGNQMPRGVSGMVAADQQVWVAVQQSSIIKSYNSTTFECLCEINVTPDVTKILAGCDDIIRQHKSACLRVTALLAAPDKSLWIGTSAGVLLTISSSGQNLTVSPLAHGHTGQVRFLTCCVTRDSWTVVSGGDGYEEFRGVPPLVGSSGVSFSGVVTGLGGDAAGDLSGREDSTNHLLIWKVAKLM